MASATFLRSLTMVVEAVCDDPVAGARKLAVRAPAAWALRTSTTLLVVQFCHCIQVLLDALALDPNGPSNVSAYCDALRNTLPLLQLDHCRGAVNVEVG